MRSPPGRYRRSRPACLRPVLRRSREPLMEFRSGPAGSLSPGTDPAALRVITTAVLVGLVASGVALASGLGLLPGGPAAPRPLAGRALATARPRRSASDCSARPP